MRILLGNVHGKYHELHDGGTRAWAHRNGTIPAVHAGRVRLAKDAGRAIMTLVEKDIRPRDILTMEAFENALAVDLALRRIYKHPAPPSCDRMGGGTEALLFFELFQRDRCKGPSSLFNEPGLPSSHRRPRQAGGVEGLMARLLEKGPDTRRTDNCHR